MCAAGAVSSRGQQTCPQGQYCIAGVATPCLPGTYNSDLGGTSKDSCTQCPAGRYNPMPQGTDFSSCLACARYEGSNANASNCWPGVMSMIASDPEPIVPGLSSDDVLTIYFTKATNRPALTVASAQDPVQNDTASAFVVIEPWLCTQYVAVWQSGGDAVVPGAAERVVIRMTGTINPDVVGTEIAAVNVSLQGVAGLQDVNHTSQVLSLPPTPITGTWGQASQPKLLLQYGVVALDYGNQIGVGVGDVLLLQFNQPVAHVPLGSKAAVDALLEFSYPGWAANYVGQWISDSVMTLNVTAVSPPSTSSALLAYASAVSPGALTVTVLASGGLTSRDGTGAACNDSDVVVGDWGSGVADLAVNVLSHQALQVSFNPLLSAVALPRTFSVRYANVSVGGAWLSTPAGTDNVTTAVSVVTVLSPLAAVPWYVQVVSTASQPQSGLKLPYGPLKPLTVSYPNCTSAAPLGGVADAVLAQQASCTAQYWTALKQASAVVAVTPAPPAITSVAVVPQAGTGTALPTMGGGLLTIAGRNLGRTTSWPLALQVTLSGAVDGQASRQIVMSWSACSLLQEGTQLQCVVPPGVGGNYTTVVQYDGGASAPSADRVSYAPPVIRRLDGPGTNANTTGNASITLYGAYFGPVGVARSLLAWAVPPLDQSLVFTATGCNVTVDDTEVQCVTGPGAGQHLLWQVQVEGLVSTTPASNYNPAVVWNVTSRLYASNPTGYLGHATTGGDVIDVSGYNFGNLPQEIVVSTVSDAGTATLQCTLVVPHTALACVLAPGTGRLLSLTVSVLAQSTVYALPANGVFRYAAPVLTGLQPASLDHDVSAVLTLRGSGFGRLVGNVHVAVAPGNSSVPCNRANTSYAPVTVPQVTLLTDGLLTFQRPFIAFPVTHVVVTVTVTGQASQPFPVPLLPPEISSLSLPADSGSGPNPAANVSKVLTVSGVNLGTLSSTGDVCDGTVVTLNNRPCDALVVSIADQVLLCTTTLNNGDLVIHTLFPPASMAYNSTALSAPPAITEIKVVTSTGRRLDLASSQLPTTAYTPISIKGSQFGQSPAVTDPSISVLQLRPRVRSRLAPLGTLVSS